MRINVNKVDYNEFVRNIVILAGIVSGMMLFACLTFGILMFLWW